LGLKRLITTCYKNQNKELFSTHQSEKAIWLEYNGDRNGERIPNPEEIGINPLQDDGDFRSKECIDLLNQADIVVTNPPFSLFREYVAQLIKYDKKFLIVGSLNSITYKEIFKLIKDNKLWLGYGFSNGNAFFKTLQKKEFASGVYDEKTGLVKFRNVGWFTNFDISKRHEEIILYKTYYGNESEYPKYANYDAIEVGKVSDIPIDFEGKMGVPITFLDKYNPDQFEIIGSSMTLGEPMSKIADKGTYSSGGPRFYLDNGSGTYQRLYDRIVIRKKKVQK
jgi:hypothetical protein